MIKELGQEGQFHFPQIRTSHKDNIMAGDYHQMQRYGIRADDRDEKKMDDFEEVLSKIADWIQEAM